MIWTKKQKNRVTEWGENDIPPKTTLRTLKQKGTIRLRKKEPQPIKITNVQEISTYMEDRAAYRLLSSVKERTGHGGPQRSDKTQSRSGVISFEKGSLSKKRTTRSLIDRMRRTLRFNRRL